MKKKIALLLLPVLFLFSERALAYTVTITVSPNDTVCQLATVVFTAVITGCPNFSVQWKINNVDVAGATTTTYPTSSLADGDQVSCVVSSSSCSGSPVTSNIITMTVVICTGINEVQNNISFSLSPNPASGTFTLQSTNQQFSNSTIIILNTIGEKIQEQKLIAEKTEIDLSHHPKGIYFVKVMQGNKMAVSKIVYM